MNPIPVVNFKSVFETLPGLYLILSPDFTIIAVSNPYLEATLTKREVILGKGLFEVFPDNPEDKTADGVSNLRASLNAVCSLKQPHKMAIQKYDIRKPDGVFEERFWSPLNTPVFNEQNEIAYIIHNVVDVTISQRQKEKLIKTEANYQLLVSSIKDYAIFMVDANGCIATWNSGAANIKGFTADEVIGQPIDIFYTEADVKNRMPQLNLQQALQHGKFETEEWRKKKDGTIFWANVIITALRDEHGVFYGYSKITRDITERKNAQEKEALLSLLINQSNDAIYTLDADFKMQSWNRGAHNLYGFTEGEVLGYDPNNILRTALTPQEINKVKKEIAIKDYWNGELKHKTKDGKDIYVHSSASTIRDHTGIISGYTVVSFDIREQKRLRGQVNHLASIVEQSSEAIISRGIDQRMISWNKGAEVLLGYTKEEALGKTAIELGIIKITEEDIQAVGQEIITKGSWKSERDFFHKNGTSFFGAVVSNAVKDEYGEIKSMVFIIKDISLHKQLEAQLKKSNDELEEKVKVRTAQIIKTETRFRALTDNSNDIVTLLDKSMNIFYRSPSSVRITGWTDAEMIGVSGIKNSHPDDINKTKEIFKVLMAAPGKPVTCLLRTRHKEGHYLWMEGVINNLLEDKHVNAIVFNFRDVTERIEATQKLKTSENLFRALIENSNDIITLMDGSFKLLYRSPGAARIMGWTNEDMIGVEATRNIHVDDKPYAAEIVKEVMANPAKIVYTKFRMQHKNSGYLWLEGTLTNLLHDEYVKAIVFNFRNINERVEAEAKLIASESRFRTLIENSSDIIVLTDADFQIIYRSPSASRITGWANEEMAHVVFVQKVHEDDRNKMAGIFEECLTAPGKHIYTAYRTYSKSGACIYMEGIMINLLHDDYVKAIVLNLRDVTDKRIAAQQKEFDSNNLKALINNTDAMMWSVDQHYKLITSNDAFDVVIKTLTGNAVEKGQSILVKEAGKKLLAQYKIYYDRALNGEIFTVVEHDARAEGIWYETSFYPIRERATVIGTACFSRNITEKKKAEQALKISFDEKQAMAARMSVILNTLPANIALLNDDGCIVDVNDAWRNFAKDNGFIGSNCCIGDNYVNISSGAAGEANEDGKKVASGIKAVLKKSAIDFVHEYTCHSPHQKRWFRMVVTPLQGKEYAGAVVMHLDISELRRLETERLQEKIEEQKKIAKAMLIGQEKERNHLGQELHDNINQILASTKIFLAIAAKKNKEAKELIKYPIELVDMSIEEIRLLSHKMVMPLNNVNLEALITELLDKLDLSTKIKTKLTYAVADQPLSDDLKLNIYRVIQELINNILKYAAAKKVTINIKAIKNIITIVVKDDGNGFNPEKKRNGIGISNIVNRVKSFNGDVLIESAEGKGCTTSITIPY